MKQYVQTGISIALAVAGIALAFLIIYKLAALLVLALIALVITTGIEPAVQRLQRITLRGRPVPRAAATLCIVFAVALVLLGLMAYFLITATQEGIRFAGEDWPKLQTRLLSWLDHLSGQYPGVVPSSQSLIARIGEQSEKLTGYLISATRAVLGALGGLLSLVPIFILTLFFSLFKDGIVYTLLQFVPPAHQPRVTAVARLAAMKMGGWLRGQIILAVIILLTTWLGMLALRVPYAAIIGIVGGVGEMIPMLGPAIAAVPAFLILLATPGTPLWQFVLVFAFFIALSQVENYILSPKVMERHVELSPVTTVCALFAGGALLGIVGALLAVPLAAAGRVILFEAVFPAIQGKTRSDIDAGCPGAPPPVGPVETPAPAPEPLPAPEPAPPADRKKRRKGAAR